MKIGIDARTILNPEKGEAIGVGHYTYQLIRHLLRLDKKNEYVLFFDFHVRKKDIQKFHQANVKRKFYPFSDYKKYLPGAYNEILGAATLTREHLDVLHSTSPMSRIPISYRGKTIVTVHDLAVHKVPEVFPKLKRTKIKTKLNLMVGKADKIIAVSNSTKKDIQEIYKYPANQIKVIYGGFDKRLFDLANISRKEFLKKYALKRNEKYLLFLGTIEPVKNITRLLEAFKIFRERVVKKDKNINYKLILAGKNGWLSNEYKQIVRDFGIEKEVIFTGYVVGDDLVPLFKYADFFVMPSLYEGFGMTVLEAFATETPAIISGVSSLPEVAGKSAYFINPLDVNSIADAMLKLATNEELKNKYRLRGREQLKKFDWERCAQETLAVYQKFNQKNK